MEEFPAAIEKLHSAFVDVGGRNQDLLQELVDQHSDPDAAFSTKQTNTMLADSFAVQRLLAKISVEADDKLRSQLLEQLVDICHKWRKNGHD